MRKPGDRIDRYVVEAILGRGGMGEVYEASDSRLGRRVALKVLRRDADPASNQRMLREARAAAALEHPNAVVVYDVGESDGEPYLAMELVRGKPLRAFVGDPDIPLDRRLRWLVDIARALGAAHRAGIVHRDIKPDNVMVRPDGVIKVLDFGIARRKTNPVDPSAPTLADSEPLGTLTEAGAIVGTPRYAAPEQLRGEAVDGGTDQFAWGILAFELLSGKPPWSSTDGVQLISQILSSPTPALESNAEPLPAEVERAILKSLEKGREARFPTIDAAADAIEPFAAAPAAPAEGGRSTPPPRSRQKPPRAVRIAKGTARVFFYVAAALGTLFIGALIFGAVRGTLHIDLGDEDAGADAGSTLVEGLSCSEATVDGPDPGGEMAAAIGIGACARLATEIGTEWRVEGGSHRLDVSVKLGSPSHVTLQVGAEEASAEAATPLEAVTKAAADLASRFRGPPLSEEQQRAWGATDEESARQIERAWLRAMLYVTTDDEAAARELVAAYPNSPWGHMLHAFVVRRGGAESRAAIDRALSKLDGLPPARQKGLKGVLLFIRSADERDEALRLLRSAYSEAPDDPDIAGLYAAVAAYAAPEEGFAVIDRLAEKFPTRSIVPLTNAVSSPDDWVPERDARYLAKLEKILPESRAWWHAVRHHMLSGDFARAREALAFGVKLGQAHARVNSDGIRASVELAALEPTEARRIAKTLLGDPRGGETAAGGWITAASYAMEGKMIDADGALGAELVRQRDSEAPLHALRFAIQDLRQRRQLGWKAPAADRLDWIDETLRAAAELPPDELAYQRTELALARGVTGEAGRSALEEIEKLADGELPPARRQSLLVSTLPLVRKVRGDDAAIRLWKENSRATFHARVRSALDAALALEAAGDDDDAIAAYRLSFHPLASGRGLEYVGARLRLAQLLRKGGRGQEASELQSVVDKVWREADAGVAEAFLSLR